MLKHLRLRLTLLYLISTIILVAAVGSGAYALLQYYFSANTDLTLQYRMAKEFTLLNEALPKELEDAEQNYLNNRDQLLIRPGPGRPNWGPIDLEMTPDRKPPPILSLGPPRWRADEADLAATFALWLDNSGKLVSSQDLQNLPIPPNVKAVERARMTGYDWSVVRVEYGVPVRLLTYRLPSESGKVAFLQVGRGLLDQELVLRGLLTGLLLLAGFSALGVGLLSWWLSGRSIRPVQLAWERQQIFIANASHEFKTPLTLIRATAEVLARGKGSDSGRQALLGDVLQEVDHASGMVEDLLLISRLDAGALPLVRQPVEVQALLEAVRRHFSALADEKRISVIVLEAQGTVMGDLDRLTQVLYILLDNAMKYTPPGGSIKLNAMPHGKEVEIQVVDNGAGIAPEHLPHLFERFYQADAAHSNESNGSGLGLSIAEALLKVMGGKIRVESELGQGTSVLIRLPRQEHTTN